MPDTLVEACRTEGQICCGSFVWVIIFLPLCGSPGDPPLPRSPPANAFTFESGTLPCRSPVISEARPWRAPLKRDARWIRFCRIRSVRMLVQKATSHQPGARSFQSKNQIGRSGPSRSAPAAEWVCPSFSIRVDAENEGWSLTGARGLRWPNIAAGRPSSAPDALHRALRRASGT